MLAYNQMDYIGQAIESVMCQRTDFFFELVIGDDFSTDGTREICEDFKKKYPDQIRLILNEKNLGIGTNYVKILSECKGKYVAICDGDDYWIDVQKLQKQVDFLENHQNFKIVFTNNQNLYPNGKRDIRNSKEIPRNSSFEQLVFANYIASVTVMFYRDNLSQELKWIITQLPYGDWPTYLWVVRDGSRIHFIDEVMAVYRKDFGTSTALRRSRIKIGQINLSILKKMQGLKEMKANKSLLDQGILKYQSGLIASHNHDREFLKALKLFIPIIYKKPSKSPFHLFIFP